MARRTGMWVGIVLAVLLVVTHAGWFPNAIDAGITNSHQGQEPGDYRQSLEQAIGLIPALNSPLSEVELVSEAQDQAGVVAFKKDGCYWVDNPGFRFDDEGSLVHVAKTWNSGEQDPCFPVD